MKNSRDVYKLRFDDANRIIYQLPDDIIQNTIKAYSFSPTSATGYSGSGAHRPLLRAGELPGTALP